MQFGFAKWSGTSATQSHPSAGPLCLPKILPGVYGGPERDTQHYVRTRFFGRDCCIEVNTLDLTLRDAAKFRRLPTTTNLPLVYLEGGKATTT
jgi:hypothetical protein